MRLFLTVFLLAVLAVAGSNLRGQDSELSKIRQFAEKFQTDDGLSRRVVFEEFEREFPPNQRAAFLVQMWDLVKDSRAETDVRLSIVAYLASKDVDHMPWNDSLKDRVISARTAKNSQLKRVALNTMTKRRTPDMRSNIVAFLSDEDEDVRELALIEVSRWKDAPQVLESYIRTNTNKPSRNRSVKKARFLLSQRRLRGNKP